MKILHVISAPAAGGVEVYVKDLAKELVESGHSAHIGFLERAEDVGRSIEFQQQYLAELKAVGVKYFFIGHEARRQPWVGMVRVRRYVRSHEIEVYHAHLTLGAVLGALVTIPRVYTHHSAKMRLARSIFAPVRSLIDQFVAISDDCARVLSAHTRRQVTIIRNGIDVRKVASASLVPRRIGQTVDCISVGRICEDKNYGLMVSAISLLPPSVRSCLRLKIAGEGSAEDTADLREQIADRGLDTTIQLLGNRTDIMNLMAGSQVFMMSSACEGLPIALIEASLSGLPCIVTDVGGCREVIQICQNGAVVEPGNAQAFADAILRIVENHELLAQYSANALRLSHEFSIVRALADHIALYQSMLLARGG